MNDLRTVTGAPAVLVPFAAAGVLGPSDVHAAAALCRAVGEDRDEVLLAAALAVRAPRAGHVCLDLPGARAAVLVDAEDPDDAAAVAALAWPADPAVWRAAVATSALVRGDDAPLHLAGDLLYLDRYRRYESLVVDRLRARAGALMPGVDVAALRAALDRRVPTGGDRAPAGGTAVHDPAVHDPAGGVPAGGDRAAAPDGQRRAVATAVLRRFAVVTGGPGTGKTHTVAQLVAVLQDLAGADGRPPRIALAAPTGKAAARLAEAVGATVPGATASTLHRLLRTRPGSRTRFRHGPAEPLPHDVVVVDEASMVSLALMAALLAAVRDDARLVLVGDHEQLRSVEAGAVLRDVVGPPGAPRSAGWLAALAVATGGSREPGPPGPASGLADAVVVLDRQRRFGAGSGIAAVAAAVRDGDADGTVTALRGHPADVTWATGPDELRGALVAAAGAVVAHAAAGDASAALAATAALRVLCAHRHGPDGVRSWNLRVERWLEEAGADVHRRWYAGRPVLVTANDYALGVFNGDLGVVVARPGGGLDVAVAAGDTRAPPRRIPPSRLADVETVHATTVHKGQGSQVGHVIVVLPPPPSPLLTRELLYTAATRARTRLTLLAPEEAVRQAVARPLVRTSGLGAALWGDGARDTTG